MSRKNLSALRQKRGDFNSRYPVGQRVVVQVAPGETLITTTGSGAIISHDHKVVVWVDGPRGGGMFLPIDCVSPVTGLFGRRGTVVIDEGALT